MQCLFSSQTEALRAFLKDKLGLAETDVGGGWLIFDPPKADLGVHPTEGDEVPLRNCGHLLYCDDIAQTVADLRARGVEFTQDVEEYDYGLVTFFKVPATSRFSLTA